MSTKSPNKNAAHLAKCVPVAVMAALLTVSVGCIAQTPPEPPSHDALASPDTVTQGTIKRFIINPEGDVDGFTLVDGTLVRFPAHLGPLFTAAFQPGDSVKVLGVRDSSGNLDAQKINNPRDGQQIIDQPLPNDIPRLPPPLRGAGLVRLSAQGRIAHITTAKHGEPDGVVLSDGTVIKLTPPIAQQFASLLLPGMAVSAQGFGTRNNYGEALQATAFGTPGNVVQLYNGPPQVKPSLENNHALD